MSQTPLSYLYHQMRQDFRISFSFVVVYAMGDPLPSGNRMLIFCLLETKVCKARRSAVVFSTQFVWVVLVLSPHFPSSACLAGPLLPDQILKHQLSILCPESWATGQLLDPYQRRCLLSAKLCDCNPLMKSAELLSAFLHLTSGINVAKCSKNPRKLSVCTM